MCIIIKKDNNPFIITTDRNHGYNYSLINPAPQNHHLYLSSYGSRVYL